MLIKNYRWNQWAALLLTLALGGCAVIQPKFETPTVSVTSFKALPSKDLVPRFQVGLHIVNPNRAELALHGISYSIYIEEHKILNGVSNQLPVIAGYGEGDVVLQASPDLFGGIQLINDLLNQRRDGIQYRFRAKLDVKNQLQNIEVNKEGTFSLAGKATHH